MTRKNRQECLLKWTECALRLLAAALALAAAVAVQPALAHSDSCTGSDRSAIVGTTTCVDDAWLEFWDWCSRNEGGRNTDLGKPYCYKPGDLASGCGAFAAISAHSNGTHVYCNNNGATACPSAQTYSPDSHQCQDCPTGQSRGVGSNICVSNGEREFWDWCFGLGGGARPAGRGLRLLEARQSLHRMRHIRGPHKGAALFRQRHAYFLHPKRRNLLRQRTIILRRNGRMRVFGGQSANGGRRLRRLVFGGQSANGGRRLRRLVFGGQSANGGRRLRRRMFGDKLGGGGRLRFRVFGGQHNNARRRVSLRMSVGIRGGKRRMLVFVSGRANGDFGDGDLRCGFGFGVSGLVSCAGRGDNLQRSVPGAVVRKRPLRPVHIRRVHPRRGQRRKKRVHKQRAKRVRGERVLLH